MFQLEDVVRRALREDIGRGDITSGCLVGEEVHTEARILSRTDGVVAGLQAARQTFAQSDNRISFTSSMRDGDTIGEGDVVATVSGPARGILAAERVALNFLQRLSGVATATAEAVGACCDSEAQIIDTRKTTPGMRWLQKQAVRAGGGKNHRMGLDDAVLIKDNHIALAGGVANAVKKAKRCVGPTVKVEVEAETLQQVRDAIAAGADIIMLDNMSIRKMRKAVKLVDGRALVEASGGVTPATAAEVAASGVDLISMGYLTHSAAPLDMSMQVIDDRSTMGG